MSLLTVLCIHLYSVCSEMRIRWLWQNFVFDGGKEGEGTWLISISSTSLRTLLSQHSSVCYRLHQTQKLFLASTTQTQSQPSKMWLLVRTAEFSMCSRVCSVHLRNGTSAFETYETFSVQTRQDNGLLCPLTDWVMTREPRAAGHTHTKHVDKE